MREYASPVSSPPFKYTTDDFWVEIDHHRHRRCDPTRLYKLLTYVDPGPAYTKKGTLRVHQPVPHKDETESFYIAQLLHYGLKHLKSKQAAKKALLAAYENQGSNLTVPDNVYKIERDLSTEYRLKNEAANKEHDQQKLLREAAAAEERKKRKREDDEMLSEFLSEVQEQVSPTSARPQKKPRSSKPLQRLDIHKLAGSYVVAAPEVSGGWDCQGPLTLELAPSSTASHLWGSFDFGVFEGKLRSSSIVAPTDNIIKFLWRGRETGMGETTYGPENVVEFQFVGQGKFVGTMYWDCLGEFRLAGKVDEAASRKRVFQKDVPEWKSEFWSINDANYENERVGRWGGWGGWEDETESNSDTAEEGSEDEEEEEKDEDEEDEEKDEDELN